MRNVESCDVYTPLPRAGANLRAGHSHANTLSEQLLFSFPFYDGNKTSLVMHNFREVFIFLGEITDKGNLNPVVFNS